MCEFCKILQTEYESADLNTEIHFGSLSCDFKFYNDYFVKIVEYKVRREKLDLIHFCNCL